MVKIALAVFLIAHGLVHTGLGVRTSRGFLSRLITNHSRNPIPHALLSQFNPREVLCEDSLANSRRGFRLHLVAAADPLLASLVGSRRPNLPRVFITLNHKSLQKPNPSRIICSIQPAGGFLCEHSLANAAVGKMAATGYDWLIIDSASLIR